ncbi:MAG: ATP-grasp domain-containing protein [Bacteroidia bacterium]|nr:ATP-grasp domain-containing protein [Bacteroidia bacterium]
MKAIILYNEMSENPKEDELDVLDQVKLVSEALVYYGYQVEELFFSLAVNDVLTQITRRKPDIIFNLVESVDGNNELLSLSPMILQHAGTKFTGSPADALFMTTNKILTKKLLENAGLECPSWFDVSGAASLDPSKKYIFKPISEDGSIGLDEESVFAGNDFAFIEKLQKWDKPGYFIEEYIEGREFNLSILAGNDGPEVFPTAEILFTGYPDDKPKVVGYRAKWIEDSFEYLNTRRTFEFSRSDSEMLENMKTIALKCWKVFGLKGYARVDFRCSADNVPYILEVNANPCIARGSGFVAAAYQAGLKYHEIIKRIIEDANGRN